MNNNKKYLIVIGGPTASGKTGFAIRLAQHYGTVILSADSRQFFKEMAIGTARPSEEELSAAPHYFIANRSIQEDYSVGNYEREALQVSDDVFQTHDIAILVGGSGLYIKALCEGLDEFPDVPDAVRQQVTRDYESKGIAFLQEELLQLDPAYYHQVDLQNPHRLMRAISVCRASGKPFTHFWNANSHQRPFTPIYLQMQWPRQQLYDRINQRVDIMLASGLEEEVKSLRQYQQHTALQTVGYQEFFDFFEGKTSRDQAIELIKRNSRRYAKRQMTWYRRDGHWKLFHPSEWTTALSYIDAFISQGVIIETLLEGNGEHKSKKVHLRQHERILLEADMPDRKAQTLAMITSWQDVSEQWRQWFLHELYMQQIDESLIIYAPYKLSDFLYGWNVESYVPEKGWPLQLWQSYQTNFPDARAYIMPPNQD